MREHGTRAKYVIEKCRCVPCTEANRAYARGRDRASRRPDEHLGSVFVPAGPVRTHLLDLRAQGVGRRAVVKASGVADTAISKILNGQSRKVKRTTADKLFAVAPSAIAGNVRVDASESWRLIDLMLAAGLTKVSIARRIHGPNALALQLRRTQISARHAATIAALACEVLVDETEARNDRARAAATDRDALFNTLADVLEERQAEWRRRAACNRPGIPTSAFFPGRGEHADAASDICNRCEVLGECRAFAVDNYISDGYWAGTTERVRRTLRRAAA